MMIISLSKSIQFGAVFNHGLTLQKGMQNLTLLKGARLFQRYGFPGLLNQEINH